MKSKGVKRGQFFLSGSGFYAHNVKCIKNVQILAVAKQSLCGHSSASSFRQSTGFETAVRPAVARKSAEYPQLNCTTSATL